MEFCEQWSLHLEALRLLVDAVQDGPQEFVDGCLNTIVLVCGELRRMKASETQGVA